MDNKERVLPIIAAATTALLLYTASSFVSDKHKKNASKQGAKEIPLPGSRYLYVGHMLSLGSLPTKTIADWHKELGPIIMLQMGVQTWVSVDDPTLAQKIFVTHGTETSFRPHSAFAYHYHSKGGKGLAMAQPGSGWREARSAAVSVLAPKLVDKYWDSVHQQSSELVSRLVDSSATGEGFDPRKHFELYAMNNIFSACTGRSFNSVQDPEFIKLSHQIETSLKYASFENDLDNFLPALSFVGYFSSTQAKSENFIKNERDPYMKELIKEAASKDEPNIIKSFKENGFDLSEDDMIVQLFDMIGGGTDTMMVSLLWNIAIMCNHPQVQRTVAAEIDNFIKENSRLPNFKERTQVPYCVSVIKECMRYRQTSAFGLPHSVKKDVEVDGYIIPKGTTLIANIRNMHKNPDFYPDPETFYPERFMHIPKTMQAAANGKLEDRDHFNFGWGRRVCPAIYMAEMELFSAFVQILARCTIEPASNGELPDLHKEQIMGVTIVPHPYKVNFIRRTDALIV